MSFPPHPPLGRLSLLGLSIAQANAKPRNRQEWEARFGIWSRRESVTEAERIEAAKRRVTKALASSQFLAMKRWGFVPQGSWHNRTNIRGDSDVDLCVCLQDVFFFETQGGDNPTLGDLSLEPIPFTFHDFKAEVARCLQSQYGSSAINIGRKAIHLYKDDVERISVDVVPTYGFRTYGPRSLLGRSIVAQGVALLTPEEERVTNFPQQHFENGRAFHENTGRRFKKVVRILKRMRNHMADNSDLSEEVRALIRNIPSFVIECLVYNCSLDCFGHSAIYDDVAAVLSHLQSNLTKPARLGILSIAPWQSWVEINRQKLLFGSHQLTTATQVFGAIAAMRHYMGA